MMLPTGGDGLPASGLSLATPAPACDAGGMDEARITRFLEHYGAVLSAGDLLAVAACWDVPALVLADEGALVVTDRAQIEQFFGQAVEAYHAQGLMATRPTLERSEVLTDTLVAVDVRWATLDAAGAERQSERSHYILQRGADGEPRFRVTLTRTFEPRS